MSGHGHDHDHADLSALALAVAEPLLGLDPCELPTVLALAGERLLLDGATLAEGARPRPAAFDARFPELRTLLALARRSWEDYGAALVDAVRGLHDRGRLLPLSQAALDELDRLFAERGVTLRLRLFGALPAAEIVEHYIGEGVLPQQPERTAARSAVGLAYRAGKAWDQIAAAAEAERRPVLPPLPGAAAPVEAPLAEVVQRLAVVPMTPSDHRALDYLAARGAAYMRRPEAAAQGLLVSTLADHPASLRQLTAEEAGKVQRATAAAVRSGESWRDLAPRLRDALAGSPTLYNDVDRIARTELSFAHAHGAHAAMRERIADPAAAKVYKLTQPTACSDCRRIWGTPGDPVVYALEEVEAWSAAGGNFRVPRAQWRATIGPTHPNCTEGPLQLWHPEIARALDSIMARFRAGRGG